MGYYGHIKINDEILESIKYDVPSIAFSLFDYDSNYKEHVFSKQISSKSPLEDEVFEEKHYFECTISEARTRLHLKHYINFETIKDKYGAFIKDSCEIQFYFEENNEDISDENFIKFIKEECNFEVFLESNRKFYEYILDEERTKKLSTLSSEFSCDSKVFTKVFQDVIRDSGLGLYVTSCFGKLTYEETYAILFSVLEQDLVIRCDLSEVFDGDEIGPKTLRNSFSKSPKAIVLTEGTSDMNFLREAMEIVYPKFVSSFHFTDLTEVKSDCTILKSYLKVFEAAGLKENCIGIFDNDTAARQHYLEAKRKNKNDNIKIIKLPDHIDFQNYPYLNVDNGIDHSDINGKAVSIELFYPDGVLKDSSGNFEPILWSNYDSKIRTYQGHIKNKELVQDNWKKYKKYKKRNYDKTDFRRTIFLLKTIIEEITGLKGSI